MPRASPACSCLISWLSSWVTPGLGLKDPTQLFEVWTPNSHIICGLINNKFIKFQCPKWLLSKLLKLSYFAEPMWVQIRLENKQTRTIVTAGFLLKIHSKRAKRLPLWEQGICSWSFIYSFISILFLVHLIAYSCIYWAICLFYSF